LANICMETHPRPIVCIGSLVKTNSNVGYN
jgi:hypothetical protein